MGEYKESALTNRFEQHGIIDIRMGQLYHGSSPLILKTMVTSCLCVVLYHEPSSRFSMAHCILANTPGGLRSEFVDSAFELTIGHFGRHNIQPEELKAEIFGGSKIPKFGTRELEAASQKNIVTAKRLCDEHQIELAYEETGGTESRVVLVSCADCLITSFPVHDVDDD